MGDRCMMGILKCFIPYIQYTRLINLKLIRQVCIKNIFISRVKKYRMIICSHTSWDIGLCPLSHVLRHVYLGLFFSVFTRNSWTSMPVESVYSWLESAGRGREKKKAFKSISNQPLRFCILYKFAPNRKGNGSNFCLLTSLWSLLHSPNGRADFIGAACNLQAIQLK